MERRNNKKSEYSTVSSKEVLEKRSICNEATHNNINVIGKKLDVSETSNRINCSGLHSSEDDEAEDGVVVLEDIYRKGMKKGQALKLDVNLHDDDLLFEESKLELAEKPVITFNHVCTVAESEQISFEAIRKAGSRSPSPLLEVPASKVVSKQAVRPPL